MSVAETQMHYLPCGAHKGREAAERERTDSFHRDGLARLVYFNPLLCASYSDGLRARGGGRGAPARARAATPFLYPAFVGGSGPLGLHPGAARAVRLHPPRHRRTSTRGW